MLKWKISIFWAINAINFQMHKRLAVVLNIDPRYIAMIVAYFAAILNRLLIDTWLLNVCVRVPWSFSRFCQSFSKHSLAVSNRTEMASNNFDRKSQQNTKVERHPEK